MEVWVLLPEVPSILDWPSLWQARLLPIPDDFSFKAVEEEATRGQEWSKTHTSIAKRHLMFWTCSNPKLGSMNVTANTANLALEPLNLVTMSQSSLRLHPLSCLRPNLHSGDLFDGGVHLAGRLVAQAMATSPASLHEGRARFPRTQGHLSEHPFGPVGHHLL